MPLTENESSATCCTSAAPPHPPPPTGSVPSAPAWPSSAAALAAVSGALALVVAAGAFWVLPRNSATPTPPASPSPTTSATDGTTTTKAELDGLKFMITGPATIEGTAPFDVTLVVVNGTDSRWKGSLAAGLASDAEVPGMFEGGIVTAAAPVDGLPTDLGVTLPDPGRQYAGIMPAESVDLAAGETRTWTMSVRREPGSPALGRVTGWLPFAQQEGSRTDSTVATEAGTTIAVSPTGTNRSCATVQIGTWDRGEVKPWTVDLAYTAVVGADGKATWEEIAGLGDQGTYVDSTQTGKVRSSTVMRALGDLGAAEASGFGAELPDRPATLDPGRYVAYSGTQLVPITFAGSCGPSGEPISGTWTAYNDRTTGLLDCNTLGAGSLTIIATEAKAYCPTG